MRLSDLQQKDVVDVKSGKKLGYVCDLEMNGDGCKICAIIVYDVRWTDLFLIFSKPRKKRILIDQIVCVGKDVILVKV